MYTYSTKKSHINENVFMLYNHNELFPFDIGLRIPPEKHTHTYTYLVHLHTNTQQHQQHQKSLHI